MAIKEKFIGLLIIVLGILPFLTKIKSVSENYKFLSYFIPGEILYQAIIIILGILLVWRIRRKPQVR